MKKGKHERANLIRNSDEASSEKVRGGNSEKVGSGSACETKKNIETTPFRF